MNESAMRIDRHIGGKRSPGRGIQCRFHFGRGHLGHRFGGLHGGFHLGLFFCLHPGGFFRQVRIVLARRIQDLAGIFRLGEVEAAFVRIAFKLDDDISGGQAGGR